MRIVDIEETRRSSKLLQIGLSERLLQNDIDKILGNLIVAVLEVIGQVDLGLRVLVNLDLSSLASVDRGEDQRFIQLCQSVDGLTTDHVRAQCLLQGSLLGLNDVVDP